MVSGSRFKVQGDEKGSAFASILKSETFELFLKYTVQTVQFKTSHNFCQNIFDQPVMFICWRERSICGGQFKWPKLFKRFKRLKRPLKPLYPFPYEHDGDGCDDEAEDAG